MPAFHGDGGQERFEAIASALFELGEEVVRNMGVDGELGAVDEDAAQDAAEIRRKAGLFSKGIFQVPPNFANVKMVEDKAAPWISARKAGCKRR